MRCRDLAGVQSGHPSTKVIALCGWKGSHEDLNLLGQRRLAMATTICVEGSLRKTQGAGTVTKSTFGFSISARRALWIAPSAPRQFIAAKYATEAFI